ncbi:MAG: MerR family transcriptional regulator [Crocinitomicaceae bacterium]|nr:MerR family transcriptional regulator [Crocinitomicaceae bacterium]
MKIGEIASKTGVSRDTVRLYEKLGLLVNVTRPYEYNNYKEYGQENVYRIGMIKEMQRIGLKLKECKSVIDALVNDEMQMDDRKAFIQSKIEDTKEKIRSLRKIQSFLQEHLDNDCAYNSESMVAKLKGN